MERQREAWGRPATGEAAPGGDPDDVYGRPLARALDSVGVGGAWRCADVGAGSGEVTAELARRVGPAGAVVAVDADPDRRAALEALGPPVGVVVQRAEDLALPWPADLVVCRFLLLQVARPALVVQRMAEAVRPGGWVVVQEPVTSAGRVGGRPLSMPGARHPDVGAVTTGLAVDAGLAVVEAWAESLAGCGPGPVASYLEAMTGADPGDEPVLLPPLVTVVATRR